MRILAFLALANVAIAVTACEEANPASPAVIGTARAGTSSTPAETPSAPNIPDGRSSLCPTNRGTMSADVNGEKWTSTCVQAAAWTAGVLSIAATNGTEVITLGVNASVPGTADALRGASGTIVRAANGATWMSGPGGTITINLTRIDLGGAAGTFSFSAAAVAGTPATGTRTVTNGIFSVIF